MVLLPLHSALQIKKTLRAFLSGRWTRLREEQVNQFDKNDNKGDEVDNKGGEVDDNIDNKEQGNEVSGQLVNEYITEILLKNEPLENIAASPHNEDYKVLVDIDQEREDKHILKQGDGWGCTLCGKILSSRKAMRTHVKKKCKLRQTQKEDLDIDTKEDFEETEDLFSHLPRHRPHKWMVYFPISLRATLLMAQRTTGANWAALFPRLTSAWRKICTEWPSK